MKKLWIAVIFSLLIINTPSVISTAAPVSTGTFTLSSPAFKNNGFMPSVFGCRGQNKSPALQWENPPAGTKSFAIFFRDLNVTWTHWDISNIPATYTQLPENIPAKAVWNDGIRQGRNSFGDTGYGGPCPPARTHRYEFEIKALDENNKVLQKAKLIVNSDG